MTRPPGPQAQYPNTSSGTTGNLHHPDAARRRQAIIDAARQGNLDALPDLNQITRLDPDPELRELARQAIRHLHRRQPGQAAADPLGFDRAHQQVLAALEVARTQGAAAAITRLSEALHLDPSLAEDRDVQRIAAEATGLPPAEAVKALIYAERYGALVRQDRGGWQPHRPPRLMNWIILLALMGLVAALFLRTGAFNNYLNSLQTSAWREHLRRAGTTDYYLFVPETPAPPNGWGILVVLHDYSQGADSLLPQFVDRARAAGLILVAPTFGEYPLPLSQATTPALDAILGEVRRDYAPDNRGAVLFGYRTGGEVAMLYTAEYYQVAGVVAVGAPELVMPPADDPYIEYLLMYGEYDPARTYMDALSDLLVNYPNPSEVLITPGIGITLEDRQVDRVLEFARQIYGR